MRITPEQFQEAMQEIADYHDPISAHSLAVMLMIAVLDEFGYEDGIAILRSIIIAKSRL